MHSISRRRFVGQCGLAITAAISSSAFVSADEAVKVQRLNWAGVRFSSGSTELLIDAVLTDIWQGESPFPFVKPELEGSRRYALITHNHSDHFDSAGLKEALGERGRVICHEDLAAYVASSGTSNYICEIL